MRLSKIGTLLLVVLLPAAAMAQGSGSTRGQPDSRSARGQLDSRSAFAVTRTVKGTIAEINADDGLLVVEDKKGRRYEFRVDDETKFKADKEDRAPGQEGYLAQ